MAKTNSERQKAFRDRMKESGMVLLRKWIPNDKKLWSEIMELIEGYKG